MKNVLTDTKVKNAKPAATGNARKLSDGGGLYLLVQPSGARLWRYKYRINGVERLHAIGVYPQVTLAKAREAHAWARERVAEGEHPGQVRKLHKLKKAHDGADNFRAVAEEWIGKKAASWSPYYLTQVRRSMNADVYPAIGPIPIRKVTTQHVRAILKAVEGRGAEVVAGNIRQWCSSVFRYACVHGRADADPTAILKGLIVRPKIKHNVSLTPAQITDLLTRLQSSGGSRVTKIAIELLLLTFVRTVELRKALWDEFDANGDPLWRVPAERMKMGVEHLVPLSKQAITLLSELRLITGTSKWLFPNNRRPDDCMTATTINRALERMGLAGAGTIGFSAHGFRGTASTLLHEWDFPSEAIERQLAHAEGNKTLAAYNKAEYLKNRRDIMQAWADKIDEFRPET